MEQKEIRKSKREGNESEIRKNALYGEVFREIVGKAARSGEQDI